jgi:hypothetical protein
VPRVGIAFCSCDWNGCIGGALQEGNPFNVEVRVGQAVETVGQAGKPKTITGFVTHQTPVVIGVKDRAELVDDAHIALTNVLEGPVILRPNPQAKVKKVVGNAAAGAAASHLWAD